MGSVHSQESVNLIIQETINELIAISEPVKIVDDVYAETGIGYLVITINPCKPILREVPLNTPNCYKTLVDAKEAARQVIQNAIADAKTALVELRQVGIKPITYITL